MHFAQPMAAVAFAALLILVFLGYWRHRPRAVTVTSLKLWAAIPDRLPPIEKKRAPRVPWLHVAAAAMLVLAMMGPYTFTAGTAPRRVIVAVDTSPRMEAGARIAQASQILARWREANDVEVHVARGRDDLTIEPRAVDLEALAARIAAIDGARYLITDRAFEWPGVTVVRVGAPMPNAGIVDVSEAGGRLAVTVQGDGLLELRVAGEIQGVQVHGERTIFFDTPAAPFAIELSPPDAFPRDNRVTMERAEPTIRVAYEGDPALRRVLAADPRVIFGDGGIRVRVGEVIEVFRGDFPRASGGEPRAPGALELADHRLFEHVRADEITAATARSVHGTWLIRDDRVLCAYEPGRVVCGLSVEGWSSQVSFPIFWHNVLTFVAGDSAAGWRPATDALLDREQSTIPAKPAPPPPALDSAPGTRKLGLDVASLVVAAGLMLAAWWAERRV